MSDSKVIEDYIAYVEEQIKQYEKFSTIHREDNLTPEMINTALATYQSIHTGLIGEYNRAKINQYELEKKFDKWWLEKFSEVRKEMIKELNQKSIKISVTEYESETKLRYSDAYWKFQDEITTAENKTQFMLRLLESWKKFDNILVNLSLNMRSELRALSIENRINVETDTVRTFQKRRPV